ncbi:MAG: monoamine oxidase [Myxococcota bacterium]|jgi:monoamine oxidase
MTQLGCKGWSHEIQETRRGAPGFRCVPQRNSGSDGPMVRWSDGPIIDNRRVRVPGRATPELSAKKQAAIGRLGVGVLDNVAMRFEPPFWPKQTEFFGYVSETPGEFPVFMNMLPYIQQPSLVALHSADFARATEKQSDEVIIARLVAILSKLAGAVIPLPCAFAITHWASDPFALGSYAHFPVGATPKDLDELARAEGRIRFAGEATMRSYPATVHGAYLSGVPEAKALRA